jgi:hypothetical protein
MDEHPPAKRHQRLELDRAVIDAGDERVFQRRSAAGEFGVVDEGRAEEW